MKNLTINLHVTEACNLSCDYCFAHWSVNNEIFRNESRFLKFIEFLDQQSRQSLGIEKLTINFAGGEPALLKHLDKGAELCHELGIRTSIITNGLLFRRFSSEEISVLFDTVGVSIDSFNQSTNATIGRISSAGKSFDYEAIIDSLRILKTKFGTKTKVNTVVSNHNFNEDLSKKIASADIDRWKIFQLLPVNLQQEVSKERFDSFVDINSSFDSPVVEDNEDMMKSYVMVNSNGDLYQSDRVDGEIKYRYFDLKTGSLFEGLRHVGIDFGKYRKRYTIPPSFQEFEAQVGAGL